MKKVMTGLLSGVLAGVMMLGGCATPTEPFTPHADHVPLEHYPKITAPAELASFLAVSPTTIEKGDVMKVTTPVRLISKPGRWAKVQYRYIFLDERGTPVRGQPDWQPITMEPQQQVFMTQNSLDTNAADWRLEIRSQR